MARKSDTEGKVLSATDASRGFSAILDRVERGERFIVERHGRPACLITAPPVAGRRASECLALLAARPPVLLDDRFGTDLLEILAGEPEERRPWDS